MFTQQRATVQQLQTDCLRMHGFVPKSCEIAEAKERRGHQVNPAWNRSNAQRQEVRPSKMADVEATLARNGW